MEEKRGLLAKCAATTLSSKLIGGGKEFFASMVVDAVIAIRDEDRINMIGIKKVNMDIHFSYIFIFDKAIIHHSMFFLSETT